MLIILAPLWTRVSFSKASYDHFIPTKNSRFIDHFASLDFIPSRVRWFQPIHLYER